jgi:hypothetical protein
METARGLPVAALGLFVGSGLALAQDQPVFRSSPDEKGLLVESLRSLRATAVGLGKTHSGAGLSGVIAGIVRSTEWLDSKAQEWLQSPGGPYEGRQLRRAVDRMLVALKNPPPGDRLASFLADIRDDLAIKTDHCRAKGLATPQRVFVVTKRKGREEVKGLAVAYIEKFFASDPGARPLEFRQFSSPAVDDLAPGRYVIWATETDGAKRSGPRKEARIGNGLPKEPIEVLTP